MSPPVEIRFERGILAIAFHLPRLDAAAASDLKKVCEEKWPGSGVSIVDVDLKEVEFIDSSGIGILLGFYRRLPLPHGRIRILNASIGVRSVVELLRLQKVLGLDEG